MNIYIYIYICICRSLSHSFVSAMRPEFKGALSFNQGGVLKMPVASV